MVSMTTLVLVASALTAAGTLSGKWNEWHTTQAELEAQVSPIVEAQTAATEERGEIRRESRCQALNIRIAILEQQIWQMEQAGPTSQRLVEKRRELSTLLDKRESLHCSEFD